MARTRTAREYPLQTGRDAEGYGTLHFADCDRIDRAIFNLTRGRVICIREYSGTKQDTEYAYGIRLATDKALTKSELRYLDGFAQGIITRQ